MKKELQKLLSVLFLFFIQFSCFSQTYYTPESPLIIKKGNFTKGAIYNKIKNHQPPPIYAEMDLISVEQNVQLTEINVNEELEKKWKLITDLLSLKSELRAKAGVEEMRLQLVEKKQAKEKIKTDLEEALKNIDFQGFYAMIVPVPPDKIFSISNAELKQIGRSALAAQAIETYKGMFISSLTEVRNAVLLSDYIKAIVSGSMSIENDRIQEQFSHQGNQYFLWLGKVSVKPLQKEIAETTMGQRSNTVIIDVFHSNYAEKLVNNGVNSALIERVKNLRDAEIEAIKRKNTSSTEQEKRILSEYENRFQKLDSEIIELENTIANFSRILKQFIETNTNVKFNSNDIKGSVELAMNEIDRNIMAMNNERMSIKEKELKSRTISGTQMINDPAEEIADRVMSVYNLMVTSYTTENNFKSVIEVENAVTKNYLEQRTVTLKREVETLWIYPRMVGSSIHVLVVAGFKVVGEQTQQGGGSGVSIVSTGRDYTETASGINLEMVFVQGGTFTMGCTSEQGSDCDSDEKPTFSATVSDFYIGKYEVTQAEWRAVMGSDPAELYFKGCDNCPVERVSWNDIQEFLKKLNQKTGKTYRLPTEAEWEFAARGGKKSKGYKYAGSNNIDEVAWYSSNSGSKTKPVGTKKANELGIYDMSGNVWEWCSDWYSSYTNSNKTNPTGPSSAQTNRVLRGGSWDSNARRCRVSYRSNGSPVSRDYEYGVRVVLSQ
jgi:formylglycine-generating enzyme required for sulfatase activity/uncharacterized protein YcgL (UPF0745 family)